MKVFDIVVAVDDKWGIGKNNGIPWPRLKSDLQNFKKLTSTAQDGKRNAVIMGRKTWQSEGMKKPLPGRLNVILSNSLSFFDSQERAREEIPEYVGNTHESTGLSEALRSMEDPNLYRDIDQVFVIGGGQIYSEAVNHEAFRSAYVTRVPGDHNCDVFCSDLSRVATLNKVLSEHEDNYIKYRIEHWVSMRKVAV